MKFPDGSRNNQGRTGQLSICSPQKYELVSSLETTICEAQVSLRRHFTYSASMVPRAGWGRPNWLCPRARETLGTPLFSNQGTGTRWHCLFAVYGTISTLHFPSRKSGSGTARQET